MLLKFTIAALATLMFFTQEAEGGNKKLVQRSADGADMTNTIPIRLSEVLVSNSTRRINSTASNRTARRNATWRI